MMHGLKIHSLALAAALLLSTVAAQAASAEALYFYAGETPVTVQGSSSEDVFTTTVGTLNCKNVTFSGILGEQEASTVEVEPQYLECTTFGIPTTVNVNGCMYRLQAGTFGGGKAEGTMDIVCPEGKEITATASLSGITKCTVHVPPQENLGTITYTNKATEPLEVTVSVETEGVQYTHTAGTGLGKCSSGSGFGSYTSTATAKGEGEGGGVSIAVAAPKPTFVLNPQKIDFEKKGGNTKKPTVIENKTKDEYKIDLILSTSPAYKPIFKCSGVQLKPEGDVNMKDKCTEEVECVTAGQPERDLYVIASDAYASHRAGLVNC